MHCSLFNNNGWTELFMCDFYLLYHCMYLSIYLATTCTGLALLFNIFFTGLFKLGWDDWTEWSTCSVTCDIGEETRTRRPLGDRRCEGPGNQSRSCSGPPCRCIKIIKIIKA